MIRKIYRYEIHADEKTFKLSMPRYADILSVQIQDNTPCFWAEVSPDTEPVIRTFEVFTTGQDIHYDMGVRREYVGTFQRADGAAFHLYERIN